MIFRIPLVCYSNEWKTPERTVTAATHNYNHQVVELTHLLEGMAVKPKLLEVKCPLSAKSMTISEAIESVKDFCLGKFKIEV